MTFTLTSVRVSNKVEYWIKVSINDVTIAISIVTYHDKLSQHRTKDKGLNHNWTYSTTSSKIGDCCIHFRL